MPRPDAHVLECAFTSNPDAQLEAQVWENITPYLDVKAGVRITRGRTDEFSEMQPSTMALTLWNDGRFTSNRNRNTLADEDANLRTTVGAWVSSANVNLFWSSTGPTAGTGSLALQALAAGTVEARLTTKFPVRPNFPYRFGFSSRASVPSGPIDPTQMLVKWYDASGAFISSSTVTRTDAIGVFGYVESILTAPANAYQCELYLQVLTAATGDLHRFSNIVFTNAVYWPNVKTGKKIRYGVLRKGNGKQIDTDPSFNGAAPFKGSNDLYGWESVGTGTTVIQQSTAFAQSGTNSMRLLLPAGAAGVSKTRKIIYGLVPGRQYTASLFLRVGTGDPAMTFGVTGAGSSTTTLLDVFQQRSVTFTATGPFCEIYITTNASSVGTEDIFVDAVQIEEGASVTAFESTSAQFTWRFTGEANEWPTDWLGGPAMLAQSAVSATDQFKRLGDLGELSTTLDEDVLDDVPFAYYPMNEPAGVAGSTVSAGDASGNDENPLVVKQAGTGGTITFGSEDGAIPSFYVQRRTSVLINPASVANGPYLRSTMKKIHVDPRGTAPTDVGAGATVNAFAQESTSPLTTGPLAIMTATDGSWFGIRKVSSGNITASFFNGTTGVTSEVTSGFGLTSASTSMYTATLEIETTGFCTIKFYINSILTGSPVVFDLPGGIPSWNVVSVGGRSGESYRGYIANVAFFAWPVVTGAFVGWWFSAFRGTDGAGSTSYARLQKLVVYTNLESPLRWGNNATAGFAPKSVGPQEIEGQPIEAMRKVEETEDGQFYIRADGQAILKLRGYRYNRDPSITIESERLDPEALSFRGDDFGLVNDVTATRSDGATAHIVNEESVLDHGKRKAQRDTIATTDDELRSLAAWQANAWGVQRNRITGVKISLLNDASVIATALAIDIGQKLRINSLPIQAPSATLDLFVEGWAEAISEDEWSMQFNTSPSDPYDVWQIGVAGRSEIGLTTKIGH